jgi:hypothetical protein
LAKVTYKGSKQDTQRLLNYLVVNEPDEGPSRKGVVQTQFDIYVSIAYGVCISQLIRYSEACGHYHDFLDRRLLLSRKYPPFRRACEQDRHNRLRSPTKDLNRIDKIG